MGLSLTYLIRRLLIFVFVVWAAASLNFLVPRLAPGDPIEAMLNRMSMQGANIEGKEEMIASYRERFGLDDPLHIQYLRYLQQMARLDLGYSLAKFPTKVSVIIANSLPWTLRLLLTSTLISFAVGTLIGAFVAWRGDTKWAQSLITFVVVLAAVPAYLVALGLLYFLAFKLDVFPMGGTTTIGALDQSGFARTADILYHSFLPGLSLILASFGGWVLNMRGMMINVLGSDYLTLAKAKGLPERRIFLSYATRNAILPQITHLAIALGGVVAGSALVEIIFSYPGIGWRLGQAVSGADYTVIQGITFIMVLAIAVAGLVLDLIYPRLDPRITYSRR